MASGCVCELSCSEHPVLNKRIIGTTFLQTLPWMDMSLQLIRTKKRTLCLLLELGQTVVDSLPTGTARPWHVNLFPRDSPTLTLSSFRTSTRTRDCGPKSPEAVPQVGPRIFGLTSQAECCLKMYKWRICNLSTLTMAFREWTGAYSWNWKLYKDHLT